MKTTEMIARVKEAQNYAIINDRGMPVKTETMRDLGFVLYTIAEQTSEGDSWSLVNAININLGGLPTVLLLAFQEGKGANNLLADQVQLAGVDYLINEIYPLEFDGFGELENWSKVTEEEATMLLTKAPVEVPKAELSVDLFKQVFDLIRLKYDDYYFSGIDADYVQFLHNTEDRYVDIIFDKGLVQIGHAGMSEPPRKLKISFATEPAQHGIDAAKVPDTRTGYEVKAS